MSDTDMSVSPASTTMSVPIEAPLARTHGDCLPAMPSILAQNRQGWLTVQTSCQACLHCIACTGAHCALPLPCGESHVLQDGVLCALAQGAPYADCHCRPQCGSHHLCASQWAPGSWAVLVPPCASLLVSHQIYCRVVQAVAPWQRIGGLRLLHAHFLSIAKLFICHRWFKS